MPVQRRKKGVKGQPDTPLTQYGELKKPVQFTLTPTAIALLDSEAAAKDISRSELIERKAREGAEVKQKLTELIELLQGIPTTPEKWDVSTKGKIHYGVQEAIALALKIQDSL